MFLRVTKAKNNNYISIVKAYRNSDGKPKQKVVKNLGSFRNEEEKQKLYILGKNLINSMEGASLFTATDICEVRRENWGAAAIVDRLFNSYKLDDKFSDLISNRRIEYDLISSIKYMVAMRFTEPNSKLRAFLNKDKFIGFGDFDLHHLYRSLDELYTYKTELSKHIFMKQKQMNRFDIDVVFFDVTTLYFESQKSDSLRDFGYSKDCKFGEVQLVLSLIITKCGRPIGYEIFPGNQYEGHTLLPCLVKLREQYDIKEVIIVADRGMSSFNNLKTIKDHGFDYIIASRMGNLGETHKKTILDQSAYQTLSVSDEDVVTYKSMDFERRDCKKDENGIKQILTEKLLCLYSSFRARKDAHDRRRLVIKAAEMLKSGNYKDKRGAKKYLKIKDNMSEGLDIEKIENEAKYDGYYIISYSRKDLSPSDIASTYKGLWQIEASFRTMKNFFEARPMFHWNESRIHGHIMLNFICLVFEKYLKDKLGQAAQKYSEQYLREALQGLERSVLKIGENEVASYASLSQSQKSILRAIGITEPQNHQM